MTIHDRDLCVWETSRDRRETRQELRKEKCVSGCYPRTIELPINQPTRSTLRELSLSFGSHVIAHKLPSGPQPLKSRTMSTQPQQDRIVEASTLCSDLIALVLDETVGSILLSCETDQRELHTKRSYSIARTHPHSQPSPPTSTQPSSEDDRASSWASAPRPRRPQQQELSCACHQRPSWAWRRRLPQRPSGLWWWPCS